MIEKKSHPRKITYDPRYSEMLDKHLAEFKSFTTFPAVIGVSQATVYRWLSVHEDFRAAHARLKTITIGKGDEPEFSLCPGHVDARIFLAANVREGWSPTDLAQEDLRHEYWVKGKLGWEASIAANPLAKPVTVLRW